MWMLYRITLYLHNQKHTCFAVTVCGSKTFACKLQVKLHLSGTPVIIPLVLRTFVLPHSLVHCNGLRKSSVRPDYTVFKSTLKLCTIKNINCRFFGFCPFRSCLSKTLLAGSFIRRLMT